MAAVSKGAATLISHLVRALLATCAFLNAAVTVLAHGFIAEPPARQLCNGKQTRYSVTVSGGNGGRGHVPVQLGGMPGICGDPFQANEKYPVSNLRNMPCEPQAVYKQGQNIRLKIAIVANHGGFFEFRICDKKDADLDCFKKDKHLLMTVDHPDHADWHIMEAKMKNPTQSNPEYHYVDLKLPDDVSCDHCVIMWTWWTAHHCVYPCDKEVCGFYADRNVPFIRSNTNWAMDYCDSRNPEPGQKPQIFRNCVDVSVTPDGSPPGPSSLFVEEKSSEKVSSKVEKSRKSVSQSTTKEKDDGRSSNIVEKSFFEEEKSLFREFKKSKSSRSKSKKSKDDDDEDESSKTYLTTYNLEMNRRKQSQSRLHVQRSGRSKDRSRAAKGRDRSMKGRDRSSKGRSRSGKNRNRRPKGRSLLEEAEDVEEVDSADPDSMSSAGMLIDCHDENVQDAFKSLNKFRKRHSIDAPLKCSNRATGVAENFGYMMCQQGHVVDGDPLDLFDNCELADFQFSGVCEQVLAITHPSDLPNAKEAAGDNLKKFVNSVHTEAGIGFHNCGNVTYWTYLFL